MSWIIDNTPWWVYMLILGGGGGALLAFVPGVLALLVSIWSMMPTKLKIAVGAVIAFIGVYLGGRYRGARNERDKTAAQDARATNVARETKDEVGKLSTSEVDKRLEERGDFFEEDKPRRRP